jgi:ABC-2 type transport system permease protein
LALNILIAFALTSMIGLIMVRVSDPLVPRAIFGILNTLLFFPSGAMYPIESFPAWLRAIAIIDPFTYAVHGLRALLLKRVGIITITDDLLILALFAASCLCGSLILFKRRL